MKKVDYSSEAISRRLRQTEQLRVLSLSLMKAKRLHDEKLPVERKTGDEKPQQDCIDTSCDSAQDHK